MINTNCDGIMLKKLIARCGGGGKGGAGVCWGGGGRVRALARVLVYMLGCRWAMWYF